MLVTDRLSHSSFLLHVSKSTNKILWHFLFVNYLIQSICDQMIKSCAKQLTSVKTFCILCWHTTLCLTVCHLQFIHSDVLKCGLGVKIQSRVNLYSYHKKLAVLQGEAIRFLHYGPCIIYKKTIHNYTIRVLQSRQCSNSWQYKCTKLCNHNYNDMMMLVITL